MADPTAAGSLGAALGSGERTAGRSPFVSPNDPGDGWVWCRAREMEEMHRMYAQVVHYVRDVELGTVEADVGQDDPARVLSDVLEETPSREENPEYYEKVGNATYQIMRPTSLQAITHRIVHCEYAQPALFEQDMLQLFANAQTWYGLGTPGYREMITLQRLYHQLTPSRAMVQDASGADTITARTSDVELVELRHASTQPTQYFASSVYGPGREPEDEGDWTPTHLPEAWFKGRAYHVGDWVHLMNPVDPARPIVAQLYRVYRRSDKPGVFVSACWYYRPEQTSHVDTRLFGENEVVKTGVYGEHALEDIMGEVLVLFHTTYRTLRPQAEYSATDAPVYFVEFKYDVQRAEFHPIQSWASCVPSDVREKVTPVDVFPSPSPPLQRMPSLLARGVDGPGFGHILAHVRKDEPHEYRDLFETEAAAAPTPPRAAAPVPVRPGTAALPASHPDRLRAYASFHVIASDVARRTSPANYAALQRALQHTPEMGAAELLQLEKAYGVPASLVTRLRDAARAAGVLQDAALVDAPVVPGLAPAFAANHAEGVFAPLPPATANLFYKESDGRVQWYGAPPLDGWRASAAIQDGTTHIPLPSLAYMYDYVTTHK